MQTSIMSTTRCFTCENELPDSCFECTPAGRVRRRDCKACRQKIRTARSKAAAIAHKPEEARKPNACDKCGKGPDEVDFKWRSDTVCGGWRSTCNECINSKKYHEAYRQREREKDEAAFLERNAKTHREYMKKNPDKLKDQQTKQQSVPDRRIRAYITHAKARNILFAMVDKDAMMNKMGCPCNYCGHQHQPGEALNGLDRIDADHGYTEANTVACCSPCNAMKGCMLPDEFVNHVRDIIHASGMPTESCKRLKPFGGDNDRRAAGNVDKTYQLPEDMVLELVSAPCYMCSRQPAFGIDRFDSSIGYVADNVRPCCSKCNYVKKDWPYADVIGHVDKVYAYTRFWVLDDVNMMPLKTFTGTPCQPIALVSATTQKVVIVFPSKSKASSLTGASTSMIESAIASGKLFCGYIWKYCTGAEFRKDGEQLRDCYCILWKLCVSS